MSLIRFEQSVNELICRSAWKSAAIRTGHDFHSTLLRRVAETARRIGAC